MDNVDEDLRSYRIDIGAATDMAEKAGTNRGGLLCPPSQNVGKFKDQEVVIFRSCYEAQLTGERYNSGEFIRNRPRGRPGTTWLDNVIDWREINFEGGLRPMTMELNE